MCVGFSVPGKLDVFLQALLWERLWGRCLACVTQEGRGDDHSVPFWPWNLGIVVFTPGPNLLRRVPGGGV